MPQSLTIGQGADARRIAVLAREGKGSQVIWLGGFKSDMRSTKVAALDAWAEGAGRAFLRFDYSGHGESGGSFEEAAISTWLEDALAVLARFGPGSRPILVGSSMGGWLARLAARALAGGPGAPAGLVLVAPAVDFTECLMWDTFPDEVRRTIERDGVFHQPSAYSPEPVPITRGLIDDGRRHLLLGSPIDTRCPVHILQGMEDPDVPWGHALALLEHLAGENVSLTLVKDGDHRLSRSEDLDRLLRAVEAIA